MKKYKIIINLYRIVSLCMILFLTFMLVSYNKKECSIEKKIEVVNPNYVFLGDSITDFYDLNKYYNNMPIVNSGINGNSTRDILNDMRDRIYRYNPSKVIILIGVNDIVYDISLDETINNIEKIIRNIKNKLPKCDIYIESIYPINNSDDEKINHEMLKNRDNDTIRELNKKIKVLSKKEKINYIEMYDLLKDDDNNLKLEYTKDGIHLTDEAYEIVTKKIKESIL